MKKYIVIFLFLFFLTTVNAQSKLHKFKFNIEAIPYSLSLHKTNMKNISFIFSSGYMITTNLSFKLSINESFLLFEDNTYDYKNGFGLGFGYFIFRGKKNSFLEKTKLEIIGKAETMFSNIMKTNFFLYDCSLRIFFAKMPYFSIGINYQKFHQIRNVFNCYFAFGINI